MKKAGAEIDGERVRFDPAMIEELIKIGAAAIHLPCPQSRQQRRRSAATNMLFGTVGSPPNCSDMDGGRRTGNHADYRKFLKLAQYFNCIGFISGYPVEPVDLHASIRHLEALRDAVVLTDKPFHAYSLGSERICDGIEIARIAPRHFGTSSSSASPRSSPSSTPIRR